MLSQKSEGNSLIIAIEGPDYTGKTSIATLLTEKLNEKHKAQYYKRPGGAAKCEKLKNILTNNVIESNTRQVLSVAEEILFNSETDFDNQISILDRYNPISGIVYGNKTTEEYWRYLIGTDLIRIPNLVVFIESPIEKILERATSRNKKDVMDEYFIKNANKIVSKYQSLKYELWFNSWFSHITLNNDSLEETVSSIYTIITNLRTY